MIDRNHPAVEAASMAPYEGREWMADLQRMHGGQPFREAEKQGLAAALNAALPHLTADDLRHTPAVRELMAEAWGKFQEHYADQWDEWYPEDIFPSPAPPPAVVSRESVAAFMMRHWAERLRADPNPYKETPNE